MLRVSAAELENLQLNVRSMLDDEIAWLGNFVPSEAGGLSEVDNSLLAGHLRFIRTLFACSSIDKSLFGTVLPFCSFFYFRLFVALLFILSI